MNTQTICNNTYVAKQHGGLTNKQARALQLNEIIIARNKMFEGQPGAVMDKPVQVPLSLTLVRTSPKERSGKWLSKMSLKNPKRVEKHIARLAGTFGQ